MRRLFRSSADAREHHADGNEERKGSAAAEETDLQKARWQKDRPAHQKGPVHDHQAGMAKASPVESKGPGQRCGWRGGRPREEACPAEAMGNTAPFASGRRASHTARDR